MATEIAQVTGVAAANIASVVGVLKANIATVAGVTMPSEAPTGGDEWMAWDYDPFDPLLGEWLETQVYT